MAKPDGAGEAPAKKGGALALLLPVLLLTVIAAGGGGLIGLQIVSGLKGAAKAEGKTAATPATVPAAGPDTAVRELVPIVTNLAAPDNTAWIRLQTAIVYNKTDAPQIDVTAAAIADDLLAFLRTETLQQLQGAAGLQHLREDLNERASIRSDGHVQELVIETLVVQ